MSELQAIMARRRKMAESRKEDAIAKMEAERRQHQAKAVLANTKDGNTLQSIMERRRRLADGENMEDNNTTTTGTINNTTQQQKVETSRKITTVIEHHQDESMTSDLEASHSEIIKSSHEPSLETSMSSDLAGIMEKRRRLTDSVSDGLDLSPRNKITTKTATTSLHNARQTNMPPSIAAAATGVASINTVTNNNTVGNNSSSSNLSYVKPSLQPVSPTVPSRNNNIVNNTNNVNAKPAATWFSLAPPATTSPVKANLKSFGMSNELQSLIARRKLANGEQLSASEQQAVQATPATRRSSFAGLVSLSLAPQSIQQSQSSSPSKATTTVQRSFSLAPQQQQQQQQSSNQVTVQRSISLAPQQQQSSNQATVQRSISLAPQQPQSSNQASIPISTSPQHQQTENNATSDNIVQAAVQRRALHRLSSDSSSSDEDSFAKPQTPVNSAPTIPVKSTSTATVPIKATVPTRTISNDDLLEVMSTQSKSSTEGKRPQPEIDVQPKPPALSRRKSAFLDSDSSDSDSSDSDKKPAKIVSKPKEAAPVETKEILPAVIPEPKNDKVDNDEQIKVQEEEEARALMPPPPPPPPSSTATPTKSRPSVPLTIEELNKDLKEHSKNVQDLDADVEVYKKQEEVPQRSASMGHHTETPTPDERPSRGRHLTDDEGIDSSSKLRIDGNDAARRKARPRRSRSSDGTGRMEDGRPLRRRTRKGPIEGDDSTPRPTRHRSSRSTGGDDDISRTESSRESQFSRETSPRKRVSRRKGEGAKSVDEHMSSFKNNTVGSKDSTTVTSESASHSSGENARRKASGRPSTQSTQEAAFLNTSNKSSTTESELRNNDVNATFTTDTATTNDNDAFSSNAFPPMNTSDDALQFASFGHSDLAKDSSHNMFDGVSSNFNDFAADAFGKAPVEPTMPAAVDNGGFNSAFTSDPAFDSAFDVKFDSGEAFQSNAANFFDDKVSAFDGPSNFATSVDFGTQPAKTYSNEPLEDVPALKPIQLSTKQSIVLSRQMETKPTTIPINSNILVCTKKNGKFFILEVDSERDNHVDYCVSILSPELQRQVAAKFNYTAVRVSSVKTLSTGLHETREQIRLRVAAIIDLCILESSQIMQVVAVWQWGYTTPRSVSLQYVMTPPKGEDFSYDPESLQVADSMLFLAGTSPKGPCVFMTKPSVRETWSANFVTGTGEISAFAVTQTTDRSFPYVAIGLTDKSLCVYSYESAIEGQAKGEMPKKWLFPLCRLDGESVIASLEAHRWVNGDNAKDLRDAGHCTGLSWCCLYSDSKIFLAAAYQNGLAVFHVALPVVSDPTKGYKSLPSPTQATTFAQAPLLVPVAAKRWLGMRSHASVSFTPTTLGPYVGASIIYFGSDVNESGAAYCILSYPHYRRGFIPRDLVPLKVMTTCDTTKLHPRGALSSATSNMLLTFSNVSVHRSSLSSPSLDCKSAIDLVSVPAASYPVGVSSVGDPFVSGSNQSASIYHVVMTTHSERQKSEGNRDYFDWSRPSRTYWLCRTCNEQVQQAEVPQTDKGFGDVEEVLGGASSEVVCELAEDSLLGLIPTMVLCSPCNTLCAVLYCNPLSYSNSKLTAMIAPTTTKICFVNTSSKHIVHTEAGSGVTFWPYVDKDTCRGIILSGNASCAKYFYWDASLMTIQFGAQYRPILGVTTDNSYVHCDILLSYGSPETVALAAVGTRLSDNRTCVVLSELCELNMVSKDNWSAILPNIAENRTAWFEPNEKVFCVVGLEGDDRGYRNFAVATSNRVIILSAGLDIVAEAWDPVQSFSLSPVGSFAFCYVSGNQVRYLSCLDPPLSSGTLCTLPESNIQGQHNTLLISTLPDRFLFLDSHSCSRYIELGQSSQSFLLPTAITKPCLLLDPLIANAICVGGKQNLSTPILRIVIERFGRKVASITHDDQEGLGFRGAGLSPKSYEMLCAYGLKEACTWLLTGTTKFDRSANSKILPPWMPLGPKAIGAMNTDAILHIIAAGDQYFLDYIKHPELGLSAPMPRPSESISYASIEFATGSLLNGQVEDALKLFNAAGNEISEYTLSQIVLLLAKNNPAKSTEILKNMSGYSNNLLGSSGISPNPVNCLSSLPLVVSEQKGKNSGNEAKLIQWTAPLAPTILQGGYAGRLRQTLIEQVITTHSADLSGLSDPLWLTPCIEAKHVWNEGPSKKKEDLLLLDRVEDWLGRRRPLLLGKEGASAAKDRGANTLADLLNNTNDDDDSFGGKDELESEKDGWTEGVGEGRSDESNLSAYFRMSEGDDEDSRWREEGLNDISHYQNKAVVHGDLSCFSLKPTSSSVDTGEAGKVKSIYDLVFERTGGDSSLCLSISAKRGSSTDVGALHTKEHQARQKCSIEFWFFLPETFSEMVLLRRTMGPLGDDFAKTSPTFDKNSVLFELSLSSNGAIQFRTCGGSVLNSSDYVDSSAPALDDDEDDDDLPKPQFARADSWNHVCLVLSSKGLDVSSCSATLFMKSIEVGSSAVSFIPSGKNKADVLDGSYTEELLHKSHLLFGINCDAGFRLTELRIWACERNANDINALLYEYLNCAESKKKFKVKIKSKTLSAPKGGALGTMKNKNLVSSKGLSLSLAPTTTKPSLAPKSQLAGTANSTQLQKFDPSINENKEEDFDTNFSPFGEASDKLAHAPGQLDAMLDKDDAEDATPASLWDTALPLSQQIRSSAAGAIVRGPPATRHFGGNRGGLPDFIGMDRFGVGGIAICGSEKTIVWRDNEDPPALTYPIGSSGAVVSDQMDDEGSEFLCCFLAKERRMVVFELQSRTIVVELQMTTKLNFWRFLPPEADENSLCFMLITPVGGFHWMPLEESPRPHQVWKRGPELQGKKVVNYEEGGSNGKDSTELKSRVGLVMVCKSGEQESVEAWVVPISGDSFAIQVSEDVMGACLCQPPFVEDGPFLPLLVTVHEIEEGMFINVLSITEVRSGSLQLGEVYVTQEIDESEFSNSIHDPPTLAMGSKPETICCSLANIVVVLVRRKGLVIAYELEDDDLSLIASEEVGHYIVDAVMRYSAEVGGAEIVMLLADNENSKDGRMVSFCFRAAA